MKNSVMKIISILAVILVLFLAVAPAMAEYGNYNLNEMNPAYVNCENGKKLNVRETENGKILAQLECGTQVYVIDHLHDGWTNVVLKDGRTGYVMTKFLQESKPGKYEITEREDNFRTVGQTYTVSAKALNKKTTKSVGLRVKPNKTSKAIRTLAAGDRLEVLAKGKTWLKVRDIQTGKTGYVAKDYVL